jgi:hypothetical protein
MVLLSLIRHERKRGAAFGAEPMWQAPAIGANQTGIFPNCEASARTSLLAPQLAFRRRASNHQARPVPHRFAKFVKDGPLIRLLRRLPQGLMAKAYFPIMRDGL